MKKAGLILMLAFFVFWATVHPSAAQEKKEIVIG